MERRSKFNLSLVVLNNRPDELPINIEQFLKWLNEAVPRKNLRPGDDVAIALYQSGARDLVDELIRIYTQDSVNEAPKEESWYDNDPDTKKFIDGEGW